MTTSISPGRHPSRCRRSASRVPISAPPRSSCYWPPSTAATRSTWCSGPNWSPGPPLRLRLRREWPTLADERLDVVEALPDVDVHPGQHAVGAVEPVDGELPARYVAAELHPLVARRVADVFHSQVVLVGEEVRQFVVFGCPAEHSGYCNGRLLHRVGPVFGADPGLEDGVFRRRDIADRIDVGIAGAQ